MSVVITPPNITLNVALFPSMTSSSSRDRDQQTHAALLLATTPCQVSADEKIVKVQAADSEAAA